MLKKLSSKEVGVENIKSHKNKIYISKHAHHFFGSRPVFPLMINRQLKKTNEHIKLENLLNFHPIYAQKYFKEQLCISIPPAKIKQVLHDWILYEQKIFHSNDIFLAHFDLLAVANDIHRSPIFQQAQELVDNNWDYTITSSYKKYIEALKNKRPITKQHVLLDNEEKIDNYFHRFQALCISIQNKGFLQTHNLQVTSTHSPDKDLGLAIHSDGSLLKLVGGQHRFALAHALKLAEIPMQVRMIHAELIQQVTKRHHASALQAIRLILSQLRSGQPIAQLL